MRNVFVHQMDTVVSDVLTMDSLVQEAISRATHALLTADGDAADQVIGADAHIDALREQVEEECFDLLARQQPVAGDLRVLVAAVRMVSDLERMGDLAVHIAKVAQLRLPEPAVPSELVPTVKRMADVALHMVEQTAMVIADRDVEAARRLEADDEQMDELRRRTFRVLLGETWTHGVEPAIDIALLGRYYERIGDHAVSLARRVIYLVTGTRDWNAPG